MAHMPCQICHRPAQPLMRMLISLIGSAILYFDVLAHLENLQSSIYFDILAHFLIQSAILYSDPLAHFSKLPPSTPISLLTFLICHRLLGSPCTSFFGLAFHPILLCSSMQISTAELAHTSRKSCCQGLSASLRRPKWTKKRTGEEKEPRKRKREEKNESKREKKRNRKTIKTRKNRKREKEKGKRKRKRQEEEQHLKSKFSISGFP